MTQSRFGLVPPTDEDIVKGFLNKPFIMFSWSDYNKLGLGLTQLYNNTIIYNSELNKDITIRNRVFSFKRPNNGFPNKLTKEFLLVDLLNNAKYLTEDVKLRNLEQFDKPKLMKLATKHGTRSTKQYLHEHIRYNDNMHTFTLRLDNIDANFPDIEDVLYEAGCDDALINFHNNIVYLDFTREAESFNDAVMSAIDSIRPFSCTLMVNH